MPKPKWYNTVHSGKGSKLTPIGREGTATPKMQHGWLTHGAIHRASKPRKLRRYRVFKNRISKVGLNKTGTVFETADDSMFMTLDGLMSRTQLRYGGVNQVKENKLLLSIGSLGVTPSWLAEARKLPPRVKTVITKRKEVASGRPKGPKGGVPPQVGSTGGPPSNPERMRGDPLSRPKLPAYPPEIRAKVQQGTMSKTIAKHPANWKTTSPGEPVAQPAHLKPSRRWGDVSQSTMYQHVVRAVYNRGMATKYKWKKSAAKSSQEIARRKMIVWKYSRRAKKAGGIPDRRRLALSNKGIARSRKHAKEPAGVLHGKATDYKHIVGQDPL